MSNPPHEDRSQDPQWGLPDQSAASGAGRPPEPGPSSSRYGTEPYDPQAYGRPVPEPEKFRKLKRFTLLSLAVYLINQLVSFIMMNTATFREQMISDFQQQLTAAGQTVDRSDIEGYLSMVLGVTVVFALIGLGIYLMVYYGLRAAKSWARIVGIIFAVLGAFFGIFGFVLGGPTDFATVVVTLIWIGVNVYWLVLAFNPDVARYLREVKR
ncbi:DUF3784 domain-containing protein [Nesterenkonia sphaerica]|uniref:Uncharacterized protein n=1 Tax=Nesterenkonia sphaerica TaxID=1804988 RepID=A0A5R9AE64_9MICC|nr:DUF3784 domain-containing protein [Nesterenkonia sphaerica]TLP76898.1 hypothetical protein FEF27_06560 [Nesterenkonia sphaerica]